MSAGSMGQTGPMSKGKNATALVSTLAATAAAKKVADGIWKAGSGGKKPPTDPADPEIEIREAIVWAVVSGAIVSTARMFLARRLARSERRKAQAERAAAA